MAVPRRRFLYLRHGETDWNAASRAQGLSDVPLNARGRDQAEDAARILAGHEIGAIVASPLSRARETASAVARRLGLPLAIDDDLHEVAFGEHEGDVMGRWYEDWIDGIYTPTGGESFADLSARGAAVLSRHLAAEESPGGPTLFVAHGALFRGIRQALGLPIHVRLANCVPLECRPHREGWDIAMLHDGNNDAVASR